MGLLGTGGITHGATPYSANRWYFVELRFDWEKKEVPPPRVLEAASPCAGGCIPVCQRLQPRVLARLQPRVLARLQPRVLEAAAPCDGRRPPLRTPARLQPRLRVPQVCFYVDHMLQQRHIPFRRGTSSFIGACALGNRDRCTTWFDSVEFATEVQLGHAEVQAATGHAEAWLGPLHEDLAMEGFVLRAEDSAGHVSVSQQLRPLSSLEGALRPAPAPCSPSCAGGHPTPPGCHLIPAGCHHIPAGAQRVALNDAALNDFSSLLSDRCRRPS